VNLSALFIRSAQPQHVIGTIILLHGYGGCKEYMLGAAKIFADNGFNSVIYDSRAHGKSGGDVCTFGYLEENDLSHIIDSVDGQYPEHGPISVVGVSMGAGVAVQAMANERRICCGVALAPFSTLEKMAECDLAFCSVQQRYRIVAAAEKMMGCSVARVNPLESATYIRVPVLVIHGDRDTTIPMSQSRSIFESLPNHASEWFVAEGAGHNDILYEGRPWSSSVYGRMIAFLEKWSR